MVAEAVVEVFGAADVAAHTAERLLVVTEEQVRAVALGLGALEDVAEVGAWPREHVAGSAGDLGGGDPARDAFDEEHLDVLARHAAASLKVSNRSR